MSGWLTATFEPKVVTRIRSVGKTINLEDGQEFIHEGEIDERLFLVESGTVQAYVSGAVVRTVSAGDIIGEFAFLDRRPRSAVVTRGRTASICCQ